MKKIYHWLLIAVLWLGIWWFVYRLAGHDVLFASPTDTWRELTSLWAEGSFWMAVAYSMGRILTGFLLGVVFGTALAMLTSVSPWCQDFFKPLLSIVKATPVASFIILALVWLETGLVPVFATFLVVLPIVWANVSQGIKETDRELLEMAKAFQIPQWTKIRRIYLPSVLPYGTAAATTAMGMAWKAGIAAEVIATPMNSLGKGIYNAKIYLETTELFAWTAMVILLSVILERLIVFLLSRKKAVKDS
ncbi:MAG: ABC transporter permease subunit [Bacillota bacterium]|nr:ABC transporter permease subunit [Bacillota bacterium]